MLVAYCPEQIEDTDNLDEKLDGFNHPRRRRQLILEALRVLNTDECPIQFETIPLEDAAVDIVHKVYGKVHSPGLLEFLKTAWQRWEDLGQEGRDPSGAMLIDETMSIPPLVPSNAPLPRLLRPYQQPSQHVIGQMGYYCTDTCTPIYKYVYDEIQADAAVLQRCCDDETTSTRYLLLTHPGHHGAYDSFGGYCYVNHTAALAAHYANDSSSAVAILDVDYHAGNGTFSIFDNAAFLPRVVAVASLHCDPNYDYPFHSGFLSENTDRLRNVPLPPGTTWESGYRDSLRSTLEWMTTTKPRHVLISLGLDTLKNDPCTIRRAGFALEAPRDYEKMGKLLADYLVDCQVTFIQEGGYRMDAVGKAAAAVVTSFAKAKAANTRN